MTTQMQHTIAEVIADFAHIDATRALTAAGNLARGSSVLLLVSGKMASGKDTVAARAIEELAPGAYRTRAFADPIRDDVDGLLQTARLFAATPAMLPLVLHRRHSIPLSDTEQLTALVLDAIADDGAVASSRTPAMRTLLQFYGSDVRRRTDSSVWVRRTLARLVDDLSGTSPLSVTMTDARFPDEVAWLSLLGAVTVRLEVSEDVQRERLARRDGNATSDAQLNHRSEIALDHYEGFDMFVDTDTTTADQVVAAIVRRVGLSPAA